MPLEIKSCTPADFPRVVEVERHAFADNPFSPILFPGPFPPGAAEFRVQELAAGLEDDPTTVWLKVVDPESKVPDEGIAFAKWNVHRDGSPGVRQTRAFGEGCNVPACEAVFGGLAKQSVRLLGDRRCVYLHILVTEPAHQCRGAGGLLVKWGIDKAKEFGLPAYVESTVKGHTLYKKYGFEDIELHEVDLSQYGAKEMHQNWAMMANHK